MARQELARVIEAVLPDNTDSGAVACEVADSVGPPAPVVRGERRSFIPALQYCRSADRQAEAVPLLAVRPPHVAIVC